VSPFPPPLLRILTRNEIREKRRQETEAERIIRTNKNKGNNKDKETEYYRKEH